MGNQLLNRFIKAITKDVQSFITVVYLLAVGTGMAFQYFKYTFFGINIFEYADVFDFIIAPFSDLWILGSTIVAIVFPYLLIRFEYWAERKYPNFYNKLNLGLNTKKSWTSFREYAYMLTLIGYIPLAAMFYGLKTKSQIHNSLPIEVTYTDNTTVSGVLIGKTREVLFLRVEIADAQNSKTEESKLDPDESSEEAEAKGEMEPKYKVIAIPISSAIKVFEVEGKSKAERKTTS